MEEVGAPTEQRWAVVTKKSWVSENAMTGRAKKVVLKADWGKKKVAAVWRDGRGRRIDERMLGGDDQDGEGEREER